ncbi:hypothetical protein AB0H57_24115 [Micromonospora sp. NPDC050686]|uniref:hypothetical protein n=1 Tax=unclassified Micromonospora TaxID=2617518 RepID=UPI001CA6541E|nr:hypothetical protein [Micromonospora sp. PLK6-60]MBY8875195.1 hypothetical protein [Micromonospora sp. PLK6-60]
MLYFLIAVAVALLVYAGVLVSYVRKGRRIPPSAYLVLAGLNGLLLAAILAWAIAR